MLPLSDTLVLDLTQVIAGPTAGQILGDMGADVIKIEPLNGEHFRPHFGGAWVPSMNRNKRGLALDLRTAGGRDVLMRQVRKADVFMEAFTPGVIDNLQQGMGDLAEQMRQRGPGNGQDIAEIEERERRSEDRDPLGRSDGNFGDSVDTGVDKIPLELERQRSREILDELRRRAGQAERPKDELDYIDRLLKTY